MEYTQQKIDAYHPESFFEKLDKIYASIKSRLPERLSRDQQEKLLGKLSELEEVFENLILS